VNYNAGVRLGFLLVIGFSGVTRGRVLASSLEKSARGYSTSEEIYNHRCWWVLWYSYEECPSKPTETIPERMALYQQLKAWLPGGHQKRGDKTRLRTGPKCCYKSGLGGGFINT